MKIGMKVSSLVALALVVASCGKSGGYKPLVAPAAFTTTVTNPYYPLPAGGRWIYEAKTDEGLERTVVEVTTKKKTVTLGVDVKVVRDTVRLDGDVIEDTYDWYAQDRDGAVWYMGEDSTTYKKGKATSSNGSWEAGVDGAQPGIVMPAHPEVTGKAYRQEYYKGHAEDMGEITSITATEKVPFGSFDRMVRTKDTTPLEPNVVEYKYYARGIGVILEKEEGDRVELISFTKS